MIKAGIFGATGYTGFELVKILQRHPRAEIVFAASQSSAGRWLDELYPQAPHLPLIAGDAASLDGVDVAFLALPHAAAARTAVSTLKSGVRVIDLSADFRLKNAATYAEWYGTTHPAPELLETAVYGLPEFTRDQLPDAQLVANPGCYPTTILLALLPLFRANIAIGGPIIADSKSGVSGAGRAPRPNTHFVEVAANFSPYKIGRAHRHLPEMEQLIHQFDEDLQLIFSPHLLPVPRGILSTIYVTLADGPDEAELRAVYGRAYAAEPFVHILPAGRLPTLAHVVRTNRCAIGLTLASPNTLVLTSAIDNLVKGAAGQAVQNMNVMFGIDEATGLI